MTAAGDETLAFLTSLFYDAPERFLTAFWTRNAKITHWRQLGDMDELAATAGGLAEGDDVYVSVSVAQSAFGPKRRISAAEAAGIMGLWADIDVLDEHVHKKWALPPSTEAAEELLEAVGLPASMVVNSGHGLQAWWLFEEFWEFHNEDDRLAAAQLSEAWNTTLRVRASERGWTVDSTFDLSRVMRVPGTLNHKGDPIVPVTLRSIDPDRRYGREDFEEFMVDEAALTRLGLTPQSGYLVDGALVLDPNAEPPFSKFQALCANEPKFQQSWEHKRNQRDFPDQTPSSYDFSLASFAVQANWTDQEIADLMVACRRHTSCDLKLRPDYYRRTIEKAHASMDRYRSNEVLDDAADEYEEAKHSGDDEDIREKRREVLDVVSRQLGIEVTRVIKFTSTPPSYRLVTPTGGVNVGMSKDVLSQNTMRATIAAETAHLIDRFKSPEWDKLMRVLFQAAEPQDVGLESTEAGQIYVWLSEYIQSKRPIDDRAQAATTNYPYVEDGNVFVFASGLSGWLWLSKQEHISPRDLGRQLRLFGCVPSTLNVHDDAGQPTTKSVWRLPPRDTWKT